MFIFLFRFSCFCRELEACVLRGSIISFGERRYRVTKTEQKEAEYIKLSVTSVESNFNQVNLNFFLRDICQSKEKEIKTKLDCYWLISPAVTILTMSLHAMAKHFILNLRQPLIYPCSPITLNEREIFTGLADKTANLFKNLLLLRSLRTTAQNFDLPLTLLFLAKYV